MKIIRIIPNESGSYSTIQTWNKNVPPVGFAVVPDTLDTTMFYEYNGFVTLTVEDNVVTGIIPNVEAWETWKASLPAETEEATMEEIFDALLGVDD